MATGSFIAPARSPSAWPLGLSASTYTGTKERDFSMKSGLVTLDEVALQPDGGYVVRVQGGGESGSTADVGLLIWAATFAWALEATPCRRARLLAIRDNDQQHRRLVRYFRRLGFSAIREVGAAAADLPLRLVWGGAGLLMRGDCVEGLERAWRSVQCAEPA